MAWEPGPAGEALEKLMDSRGASDEDRLEMRRMAAFLKWRKEKRQAVRDGAEPPPVPDGMREWLLGTD